MPDGKYGRLFTEADVKEIVWTVLLAEDGEITRDATDGSAEDAIGELDAARRHGHPSGTTFPADEPIFVLRGKDGAAPAAIGAYADECESIGAGQPHIAQVQHAGGAMLAWQAQNPDRVKVPD